MSICRINSFSSVKLTEMVKNINAMSHMINLLLLLDRISILMVWLDPNTSTFLNQLWMPEAFEIILWTTLKGLVYLPQRNRKERNCCHLSLREADRQAWNLQANCST